MKSISFIFGLLVCLISCQFVFSQGISSMKITPSLPTINDSVYLIVSSEGFSGDCTFNIELDSTKQNKVYVSGKYDSNNKCDTSSGIKDSINLGVFSKENYIIYFLFIDIHGLIENDELTLDFTVSQNTSLNKSEQEKKYNVYPNPCSSFLTISNLSAISEQRMIRLFNATGQQLMVKRFDASDSKITINMGCFCSGLYYLTTDDKTLNVKVIKE